MTADRWQQVKRIFEAALDLQPAEREPFLAQACGSDASLRQDVESLLLHDQGAGSFLEQSPTPLRPAEGSLAGRRFGPYQILAEIGRGGMGVVYLAEDTRLRRKTALKVLLPELTADPGRLRRFEQEARAVSALNHPNILTVFEVGEADGVHFLATEFIEGQTLRRRLQGGKLSLEETLEVAIQVAGALTASHAAGVIHRDLKPENIMLRPDGYVKVLDFGLAKLVATTPERAGETTQTMPGTVMGTLRYMSPEQARGLPADARSDVFSFGALLYEMAAGGPVFEAANAADLLAAILAKDSPPVSPAGLERIVHRCLRKQPEDRYQAMQDVLTDLKTLRADLEFRVMREGSLRRRSGLRKALIAIAAALAVAIAVASYWVLANRAARVTRPSQELRITRLTGSGAVEEAAISPDGKYLAYVMRASGGRQSVWVRQLASGSEIQIIPPANELFRGLTFSLDGNYLYYRSELFATVLYRIPVLGGPAQRLKGGVNSPISFGPGGRQFVFIRANHPQRGEESLLIASVDGGAERILTTIKKPREFAGAPAWSPDGKSIACGVTDGKSVLTQAFPVEGGAARPIGTRRWGDIGRIAWGPKGRKLFLPAAEFSWMMYSQVWELAYPGGETRRVTNDLSSYGGVTVAQGSRALVSVRQDQIINILILPKGTANQIPGGGEFLELAWTAQGSIVYESYASASGELDLWLLEPETGNRRQLTMAAGANGLPSGCGDGRHIVFVSTRTGEYQVWRMEADGGNPRPLARGGSADCSPDGKWVVYDFQDSVWRIPIDGGEPIRLADKCANPEISPDGKLIACEQAGRLGIIPFEGGPPIKTVKIEKDWFRRVRWTPDGGALAYVETRDGVASLWRQPLSGGPASRLAGCEADEILSFDWSWDGKRLACARGIRSSDVVLLSGLE